MESKNEKIPYEYILKVFKEENPKQMANKTGNDFNESTNCVELNLMGKKYSIHHPSGKIFNENNILVNSYIIKMILLRYLVNGTGDCPTGNHITFREIYGGYIYYRNFCNKTLKRLSKAYGNNLNKFEEDFKNIKCEKLNFGDSSYRFEFLKNILLTFVIWTSDEEFESHANVLLDSNIECYFNAEDLVIVIDLAIECLKNKCILSVDF